MCNSENKKIISADDLLDESIDDIHSPLDRSKKNIVLGEEGLHVGDRLSTIQKHAISPDDFTLGEGGKISSQMPPQPQLYEQGEENESRPTNYDNSTPTLHDNSVDHMQQRNEPGRLNRNLAFDANGQLMYTGKKNTSWNDFLNNELLTKKFIIKSMITIFLYWSLNMSEFLILNFWGNFIFFPILRITGLGAWLVSLAAGNETLLNQYLNLYLNNAIYVVFFLTVIPLFAKEIWRGMKMLFRQIWLIPLILPIYISNILLSDAFQKIGSIFATIPDTSKNQELIQESMSVSVLANIFPTVIGAPFVEEILFRGVIASIAYYIVYTLLKGNKKLESLSTKLKTRNYIVASIVGVLVSSVGFGLLHVIGDGKGDYLAMLPYIASGVVFATAYFATKRNLFFAILIHIFNNGLATIIISFF